MLVLVTVPQDLLGGHKTHSDSLQIMIDTTARAERLVFAFALYNTFP